MILRQLRRLFSHTKASRALQDTSGRPMTMEITDSAVQRLKEIRQRKGSDTLLRISIESGGCHGFQYHFNLDKEINPDDIVFERDTARVIIDEVSLGYLTGSQVDYARELIGDAFRIVENPRASSGCGCGVSFSLQPPPPPASKQ